MGNMKHFDKDMTMRSLNLSGAVRFFVGSICLVWALAASATAAAQVILENSVEKVETFVNEAGEPERRLVDADSVVPGDELRYTITFANDGSESVDAGSVVITNPIPEETEYLNGTAFGSGTDIVFSVDGENFAAPETLTVIRDGLEMPASAKDYQSIRWVFQPLLEPGDTGNVSFSVRLK
ncbi:MAG: hypothetical protein VB948_00190 [Pseudomonadales bacterium]